MSNSVKKLDFSIKPLKEGDPVPKLVYQEGYMEAQYGIIKKGSSTLFAFHIVPEEGVDLKNVTSKTSCGCTVASPKKFDNTYRVDISYDSKRMGNFRKNISMSSQLDGEPYKILLRITGKVIS